MADERLTSSDTERWTLPSTDGRQTSGRDEAIQSATPTSGPSVGDADWFIQFDGKERGPYTSAEMQERAKTGLIAPSSLVRCEGGPWTPASQFAFLAKCFPAESVKPAPHPDDAKPTDSLSRLRLEQAEKPIPAAQTDAAEQRKPPTWVYVLSLLAAAAVYKAVEAWADRIFGHGLLLGAALVASVLAVFASYLAAVFAQNVTLGFGRKGVLGVIVPAALIVLGVLFAVVAPRENKAISQLRDEEVARGSAADADAQPKDALFYLHRGCDWMSKSELDKAIEDFNEAIRLDPENVAAYQSRGCAWYSKKDYDKAIRDFSEAIRVDRFDMLRSASYIGRAKAWLDKGEYDKAIKDFDVVIQSHEKADEHPDLPIRPQPGTARAFYGRGKAWMHRKDYDKAINDFTVAIRLDPQEAQYYNYRGFIWSVFKKDYGKAIRDYDEAIRLDPRDVSAYNERGNAWSDKGEYDKAIRDYDEAIRLNPRFSSTYHNRAIAWQAKKEYDKAIEDFDEAIRLDPEDVIARKLRDTALARKRYRENPVATFKDKLRRGLRDTEVYEFADRPDKIEGCAPGEKLPEFGITARDGGVLVRFLPFEVPGVAAPRYRANLFFAQGKFDKFYLEAWYFRSPN